MRFFVSIVTYRSVPVHLSFTNYVVTASINASEFRSNLLSPCNGIINCNRGNASYLAILHLALIERVVKHRSTLYVEELAVLSGRVIAKLEHEIKLW